MYLLFCLLKPVVIIEPWDPKQHHQCLGIRQSMQVNKVIIIGTSLSSHTIHRSLLPSDNHVHPQNHLPSSSTSVLKKKKRERDSYPQESPPTPCTTLGAARDKWRHKSPPRATLPVLTTSLCRPGPSYSSCLCFIWDKRPWARSLSQGSRHNKILNMVNQYHSTRCPRGSRKETWVPKSIPQAGDKSPPQCPLPYPSKGHPNEQLPTQTFSGQEDRRRWRLSNSP